MNKNKKLVKNTIILSIGTLCTKVLTFVMVPFFSKWLTTSDYGMFDMLYTYITLLIPFITLSNGEAVFRKMLDANEQRKMKIVSTSLAITIVGLFIGCLGVFIIFSVIKNKYCIPFICLLISETINQLLMYFSRGNKQLKHYTLSSFLYVVFMCAFVFVFVYKLKMGLEGMLYGYIVGFNISSIILFFTTRYYKYISLKAVDKTTFNEIVKYSWPLIPNSISWWIANVSDRTIIISILGSASNGIYALANKVPAICTTMFSVFHLSWQENAVESMNDKNKEEYFNDIYNKIFILVITISSCVIAVNPFLFKYIFDHRYYEGLYQAPILITAVLISFMAQFFGSIYIAYEDTKTNGFTTVLAAVINIVINILFIKKCGLFAASFSTLLSYLVLLLVRKTIMKRKYLNIHIFSHNYLYLLIFSVFIIGNYINNFYCNFILLLSSAIIFLFSNKNIILPIILKIKNKLSNKNVKI